MEKTVEKITSRSNPVCIHVKKLGASKRYREEHGQFLCEGEKHLHEALRSGMKIECVLSAIDVSNKLPESTKVYYVKDDIIDSLSTLRSSRDLLFTCKIPEVREETFKTGTHLLLDRIQDPGNVGTIIRCAHAFGLDSVILTEGSADIYNPKTIRATMGAVFKQRVFILKHNDIYNLKCSGIRLLGTSNRADSVDISKVSLKNVIIILGNEGQGVSKELLEISDQIMNIPLASDCESLNVATAASIIMWEARKSKSR